MKRVPGTRIQGGGGGGSGTGGTYERARPVPERRVPEGPRDDLARIVPVDPVDPIIPVPTVPVVPAGRPWGRGGESRRSAPAFARANTGATVSAERVGCQPDAGAGFATIVPGDGDARVPIVPTVPTVLAIPPTPPALSRVSRRWPRVRFLAPSVSMPMVLRSASPRRSRAAREFGAHRRLGELRLVHGVRPRRQIVPLALAALVPRRAEARVAPFPAPVPVTRDDAAPTAHVPVPALFQVLFPVEAGVDVRDAGEFGVCEVDEGSRAHRTQRVVLVALVGGRTRVVRVVRVVAIEICHGEWERVLLLLLLRVLLLGRVLALALAVPRHRIFEVILERILPTRRGVPVEGRPDPATFGDSGRGSRCGHPPPTRDGVGDVPQGRNLVPRRIARRHRTSRERAPRRRACRRARRRRRSDSCRSHRRDFKPTGRVRACVERTSTCLRVRHAGIDI